MIGKPSVRVVLILQVLSIISYLVTSPLVFFLFLTSNLLLLLLISSTFRNHFLSLLKFVFIWTLFLTLVGLGRVKGGQSINVVWNESLNRLEFLSLIAFMITLAYLYVAPQEYLRIFDRLKLPRELSYIVLSSLTVVEFVRNTGRRQLQLLTIKGLGPSGFRNRFFAYYRIVGPLFSVLLSHQAVHSRSLYYRGFLNKSAGVVASAKQVTVDEMRMIFMLLLIFLSCLLISLWKLI